MTGSTVMERRRATATMAAPPATSRDDGNPTAPVCGELSEVDREEQRKSIRLGYAVVAATVISILACYWAERDASTKAPNLHQSSYTQSTPR